MTFNPMHTPGDWKLSTPTTITAEDDILIAICNPERPRAKFNGRLIVASPFMLEALWNAESMLTAFGEDAGTLEQVREAIKMAMGEDEE